MTYLEVKDAVMTLSLEDMAKLKRELADIIFYEARKYRQVSCTHPHIVDQRYGQREDQVHRMCTECGKTVG